MAQTPRQRAATRRNNLVMRLRGARSLFQIIEGMNLGDETRTLAGNLDKLTNNLEERLCKDYSLERSVFDPVLYGSKRQS